MAFRTTYRWYFDPEHPLTAQWWEERYDTGKRDAKGNIIVGWRKQTDRSAPTLTKQGLIEMWFKVLLQKQYEGKRSVSTIAKHFNKEVRYVKTQRAYINSEYQVIKGDDSAMLLPHLADFTDDEQKSIDRANDKKSVQDMYDALPPSLKALAEAYKNQQD